MAIQKICALKKRNAKKEYIVLTNNNVISLVSIARLVIMFVITITIKSAISFLSHLMFVIPVPKKQRVEKLSISILHIILIKNIMNNFLFNKITDKSLPVVCTKHAIDRAIQRCKLLMRQHERDNPRLFLLDIFRKTNPHMGVIFSPFAYNYKKS